MAILGKVIVRLETEDDRAAPPAIAWTGPASPEAVKAIHGADPDKADGFTRSEFLWIRLANGDLILGVFPQDDAYLAFEQEHV